MHPLCGSIFTRINSFSSVSAEAFSIGKPPLKITVLVGPRNDFCYSDHIDAIQKLARSERDRINNKGSSSVSDLATEKAADEAKAEAEAAAAKAEADAQKAKQAAEKAGAVIQSKVAAVAAKAAPTDSNVKQWAKWMADQLRQVPDIGVYGRLRLSDLAQRGPTAARGVWATAKDALSQEYGNITVDELLAEYQGLKPS